MLLHHPNFMAIDAVPKTVLSLALAIHYLPHFNMKSYEDAAKQLLDPIVEQQTMWPADIRRAMISLRLHRETYLCLTFVSLVSSSLKCPHVFQFPFPPLPSLSSVLTACLASADTGA